MSEHYFKFPLAVLRHGKSPAQSIDAAVDYGMLNAGIGLRTNDEDGFNDRLVEYCDKHELDAENYEDHNAALLVGAALCGVILPNPSRPDLILRKLNVFQKGGAFVTMKAEFVWAALRQARAEEDPSNPYPERGISWREFRILAALLSGKPNSREFTLMGWESIQARAAGFTSKEDFKKATTLPDHITPSLSRKQIVATVNRLESLGFFARFRLSKGKVGGLTAYSFRHPNRVELGNAVIAHTNWKRGSKTNENRASDALQCLNFLERAKSGPSVGQVGAKSGPSQGQVGANIMRNTEGEIQDGEILDGKIQERAFGNYSDSAHVGMNPPSLESASVAGMPSVEDAKTMASSIIEEEAADPYGAVGAFPPVEVIQWAIDWQLENETTGWLLKGEPIRNPRAALRRYLRSIAGTRSKRFKELSGANPEDNENPPF